MAVPSAHRPDPAWSGACGSAIAVITPRAKGSSSDIRARIIGGLLTDGLVREGADGKYGL